MDAKTKELNLLDTLAAHAYMNIVDHIQVILFLTTFLLLVVWLRWVLIIIKGAMGFEICLMYFGFYYCGFEMYFNHLKINIVVFFSNVENWWLRYPVCLKMTTYSGPLFNTPMSFMKTCQRHSDIITITYFSNEKIIVPTIEWIRIFFPWECYVISLVQTRGKNQKSSLNFHYVVIKFKSPSIKDVLCQIWLKLAQL